MVFDTEEGFSKGDAALPAIGSEVPELPGVFALRERRIHDFLPPCCLADFKIVRAVRLIACGASNAVRSLMNCQWTTF